MTESRIGMVQTVLGLIRPDELGITQTHEHLMIDTSALRKEPKEDGVKHIFLSPMTPEVSGYVRHYGVPNLDNSQLGDIDLVVKELSAYKQHGGKTVVDATSNGIGRDAVGLARISHETGLNIVMGGSYYDGRTHPADMDDKTEDQIVKEIVGDITVGVGDTGIRAGTIGEVGCTWPLTDNERKVVRASGCAQTMTGAPVLIHPGRNEAAPMEILGILSDAGVDFSRVIMSHIDRTIDDRARLTEIAETGCYLEWDLFGTEVSYYPNNPLFDMPNDAKRMDDIAWAVSKGYGDRIVISQDIFLKKQLLSYGGYGYGYILAHIVPRMRSRGYTSEVIKKILVDNPARVLTFVEPTA